jgi:hypothetical protein
MMEYVTFLEQKEIKIRFFLLGSIFDLFFTWEFLQIDFFYNPDFLTQILMGRTKFYDLPFSS